MQLKELMEKFLLNIFLSVLFSITLLSEAEGQKELSILKQLCDQSDLIIQGRVDFDLCMVKEAGVQSCLYTFRVDSIIKGNISPEEYINMFPPHSYQLARTSNSIHFHNECYYYLYFESTVQITRYFEDNCIKRGEYYILFLKRMERPSNTEYNQISHYFKLVDKWFGFQPANAYMVSYLRSLLKSNSRK